jgi:predicted permease
MVVLREIGVLAIVAGIGALALRRVSAEALARLSRLVVDVAMPALIFTQLLRTTDAATLRAEAYVPWLGGAVLALAFGVGRATASALGSMAPRPTFVFVVGTPNWIYLPLPIALAAWGEAGVRTVLLVNVGALVFLWTVGVWVLAGPRSGAVALRSVVSNPGLIATGAGVAWILAKDGVPSTPGIAGLVDVALRAVESVGAAAVPLSLLLTGAQVGSARWTPRPGLLGALVGRLIIAPAVTTAVLLGAAAVLPIPRTVVSVLVLVSAMPPALSASLFTERFGGDTALAAQSILYGTALALITVPLVMLLAA